MGGWCDERAGLRWPEDGSLMAPTVLLPPFRYFFLLHSLTQFEIVKQKEMKSLCPLAKAFKNNIRKACDYDTIKMIEMDS